MTLSWRPDSQNLFLTSFLYVQYSVRKISFLKCFSILCWQISSWLPAVLAAHAGCSYPGWQCKLDFSCFLFVFAFCCRLCGPHKYTYTHLGWQCKLDLIFYLIFVHGKFIHKLRKTLRWNFLDGETCRNNWHWGELTVWQSHVSNCIPPVHQFATADTLFGDIPN